MSKSMATTESTPITETVEDAKLINVTGCQSIELKIIFKWQTVKYVVSPQTGKKVKRETTKALESTKKTYFLREVNSEEVEKYRKDGIPSFILKMGDSLYYTEIPKKVRLTEFNLMGTHKCAQQRRECLRFSAASDEDGGCAKVRARSRRIQNFSWITKGIETFNTNSDGFIVLECKHYEA